MTSRAAPLEYVTEREAWNVYRLEDGSVVRLRVIMTRIAPNGRDENGTPQYLFENAVICQVEPAEPAAQLNKTEK